MKCQILFSGINKKNITNLLPAELSQRLVKVKVKNLFTLGANAFRIAPCLKEF